MTFDENHMPKPVSAPQDIEPWERALRTLWMDDALYADEARRSRAAAVQFVTGLRAEALEEYLMSRPAPRIRELLLQKLRQRSSR